MAALPDLHVSDSSEAMLSGRKPPFRLLVRAAHRDGRKVNIRHAVSEGFVVSIQPKHMPMGTAGALLYVHIWYILQFLCIGLCQCKVHAQARINDMHLHELSIQRLDCCMQSVDKPTYSAIANVRWQLGAHAQQARLRFPMWMIMSASWSIWARRQ